MVIRKSAMPSSAGTGGGPPPGGPPEGGPLGGVCGGLACGTAGGTCFVSVALTGICARAEPASKRAAARQDSKVRGLKRPVWRCKACLRRLESAQADFAISDRGFNPVLNEAKAPFLTFLFLIA